MDLDVPPMMMAIGEDGLEQVTVWPMDLSETAAVPPIAILGRVPDWNWPDKSVGRVRSVMAQLRWDLKWGFGYRWFLEMGFRDE